MFMFALSSFLKGQKKEDFDITVACVCLPYVFHTFRLLKQLPDYYETWYQRFSIKRHTNAIISSLL